MPSNYHRCFHAIYSLSETYELKRSRVFSIKSMGYYWKQAYDALFNNKKKKVLDNWLIFNFYLRGKRGGTLDFTAKHYI
jgi:hypothetical protein